MTGGWDGDTMAIKDARGNLHSEETGRFIEKSDVERTEAAKATYDSGVTSPYLSMEHLRQLVEHSGAPDEMLYHLIRQGFVNLTIKQGLQDKHIEGTKNYRQEIAAGRHPSILTADPAMLVKRLAGTGIPVTTSDGHWKCQEVVFASQSIGYAVDPWTGSAEKTRCAKIHYANDGAHIVPKKEDGPL